MILFLQPLTAKPSRVVIKIKYYMIKLISFFLKKKKKETNLLASHQTQDNVKIF